MGNNGATWSLRGNVTTGSGSNNQGETVFINRSDKAIFANMRSTVAGVIQNTMSYSLDNGVTWYPQPYQIGVTHSKNAMGISPSGTILTVARDNATDFTVYGVSVDGAKTFSYNRIDSRSGRNMYAGVVWDNFRRWFVTVYYVETGTQDQSPTDIVQRIVTEN
jgi:hypothetical protein